MSIGWSELAEVGQNILTGMNIAQLKELDFLEVSSPEWRKAFDEALNQLHYARACHRVGRCVRLAIIFEGNWSGGLVLGSTFPNIDVRDRALGLRKLVLNYRERGLSNPWCRENVVYWKALQRVVNHARTFIFPSFRGKGLAIKAHRLLLTKGIKMWEQKYGDKVYALDNLCDTGDSKLFANNGWTFVGETKGYRSTSEKKFSARVENMGLMVKTNAGLEEWPDGTRWEVWVKVISPAALEEIERRYGVLSLKAIHRQKHIDMSVSLA